jgi:glutathione synthase/RimK-type ligase-like ATP-grasp enzyme
MTTVILVRRGWEKDSARGVASFMGENVPVIETGENFPPRTDRVIRWGCTANAPCRSVLNRAEYIHRSSDKSGFRRLLQRDRLCPETFFNPNDLIDGLADGTITRGIFIVRPREHARGADMIECTTAAEVRRASNDFGAGSYIQRKVEKVREYRVMFVQGRVVQVVEKTPRNRGRLNWGLADINNVRWGAWPLSVVKAASKADRISQLDFDAVDVIVDRNDAAYVLEVNTAPELVGDYMFECFGKAFRRILRDNNKEAIPVAANAASWRDYIHPALVA